MSLPDRLRSGDQLTRGLRTVTVRRTKERDAEFGEDIGGTARRGRSAIAVLGDRYPAGRDDQRDGGRNVEAVLPVTPGAADVDCAIGGGNTLHPRAHGPDCPGDLGRALAAFGQFDQGSGNRLVRDLPVEDPAEQVFGFIQGHARTLGSTPAIRRKLASIAWPCSVAMLSGWNWTPWIGRL